MERNSTQIDDLIEKLRSELPTVFAATQLDALTGGGYLWRTLQNEKCSGKVPTDIFLRSGVRKLLILRDNFLDYWGKKLRAAR